jgi:hypothetical protein
LWISDTLFTFTGGEIHKRYGVFDVLPSSPRETESFDESLDSMKENLINLWSQATLVMPCPDTISPVSCFLLECL